MKTPQLLKKCFHKSIDISIPFRVQADEHSFANAMRHTLNKYFDQPTLFIVAIGNVGTNITIGQEIIQLFLLDSVA